MSAKITNLPNWIMSSYTFDIQVFNYRLVYSILKPIIKNSHNSSF